MTHFEARPGLDEAVALRVALPAVRRVAAQVRDGAQRNAPDGKTWITAHDERVRPSHVHADGQVVPDNLRYLVPKVNTGNDLNDVRAGYDQAVAPRDPNLPIGNRINCLVGSTCVQPLGTLLAVVRSPYDGPIVTIRTASGRTLVGTPNHPVWSDGRWVGLGSLDVGDDLTDVLGSDLGTHRQPDVEHGPTRIDEVFDALTDSGVAVRVPATSVDFHGDHPAGDVDVVLTRSALMLAGNPVSTEARDQLGLALAYMGSAGLPRLRSPLLLGDRVGSTSDGLVSSGGPGAALLGGGVEEPDAKRLGSRPGGDAVLDQAAPDRSSTDAARSGYGLFRFPLQVAAHDLLDRERPHSVSLWRRMHEGVDLMARQQRQRFGGLVRALRKRRSGVASASGGPTRLPKGLTQAHVLNAEGSRDLGEGLPVVVATDRILQVDWSWMSGHVYTLNTTTDAYAASGLLVRNCRCVSVPLRGVIARAVQLEDAHADGTHVSARVSVRFPRVVESEHPSEPDRGGGWFLSAVRETAAMMPRR